MPNESKGKRESGAKVGRPKGTKREPTKTFSFEMPESQHALGSEKSDQGRVFNLSMYFRLIHKYNFLQRPLEESQKELNKLRERERNEEKCR